MPNVRSEQVYFVTHPDSSVDNTQAITVHNNKGVLRKSGITDTIGAAAADIVVSGGKALVADMVRKGAKKGAEYVAEKLPKRWLPKDRKKNVSTKPRTRAADTPVVLSGRGPTPYATTAAPVALGATMTGMRTIVKKSGRGHTLRGREFLGSAYDTQTITSWTMCLGAPLTPVSFVDSMLRQYGAMYNYFRWTKLKIWYINSSSTSSTGSVMLYYNKDRASPFLSQTSPNLLPFVLSDPHTTIGPQWQNFSVELEPDSSWKRLDYGMNSDITHYSAGEVFLLSKTGADTNSPGQLLMEYEIQFKDENLTPRLLLWPQPTINYVPYEFQIPATSTVSTAVQLVLAGGAPPIGSNSNLVQLGGIYKVIVDFSNSGPWSNLTPAVTNATLFKTKLASGTTPLSIMDGTTLYAVNGSSNVRFFVSADDAYSDASEIQWTVTLTANTGNGATLFCWFSLLGFIGDKAINPNM
nr:MAG: putative coat protein [Tombusviridae sp.]